MREMLWSDLSRVSRFTVERNDSRFSAELIVPEVPECVVDVEIVLLRGDLSSFSTFLKRW